MCDNIQILKLQHMDDVSFSTIQITVYLCAIDTFMYFLVKFVIVTILCDKNTLLGQHIGVATNPLENDIPGSIINLAKFGMY